VIRTEHSKDIKLIGPLPGPKEAGMSTCRQITNFYFGAATISVAGTDRNEVQQATWVGQSAEIRARGSKHRP